MTGRAVDHSDIQVRSYDDAAAQELVAQVQQEYVDRYGGPDETPVDPGEFAPPLGLFLVAFRHGRPVGCGGWRVHGRDAEIKRMYVSPAARRTGLARRILAELERTAAEAGCERAILETGWRQPEAIALYGTSGYEPTEKFGHYRHEPGSYCFAKRLVRDPSGHDYESSGTHR